MKDKTAKMKACAAGVNIPAERAREIVEALIDSDAPDEFVAGAAFAGTFLSCPKDDPRFGMGPAEFYDYGPIMEEPPAEIVSAAMEVIEQLKAHGVKVVEAYIVKGGN